MKSISALSLTAGVMFALSSCVDQKNSFDASGSFEAQETIISSEASGVIMELDIEEGRKLEAGQLVGYVDSTQLYLKKKQLQAQIVALESRVPEVSVQLAALKSQLDAAQKEHERISNLVKADAATGKQLDDAEAQIELIKRQIEAQISTKGINKDASPLQIQIEQLEDQIEKCKIINPIPGTVLVKYAEVNEMTSPGKPLYKIADLSSIILRVYISANQLGLVKLNQEVTVFTDNGKGGMQEAKGTVVWINDKAEFTPKTIQTKDERANMVYAMKIKMKNDGTYKIGMYGEVKF